MTQAATLTRVLRIERRNWVPHRGAEHIREDKQQFCPSCDSRLEALGASWPFCRMFWS